MIVLARGMSPFRHYLVLVVSVLLCDCVFSTVDEYEDLPSDRPRIWTRLDFGTPVYIEYFVSQSLHEVHIGLDAADNDNVVLRLSVFYSRNILSLNTRYNNDWLRSPIRPSGFPFVRGEVTTIVLYPETSGIRIYASVNGTAMFSYTYEYYRDLDLSYVREIWAIGAPETQFLQFFGVGKVCRFVLVVDVYICVCMCMYQGWLQLKIVS